MGSIRAAVESLLEYPEMDPSERARFIEIVRDEALALSDQVSRAMRDYGAQLGVGSTLADVLGRDLLSAARRRLERDAGVTADVAGGDGDLWLRVDSYAVVLALAHLARRLRAEPGARALLARTAPDRAARGPRAALARRAGGRGDAARLGGGAAARQQGPGAATTLADVVAQHGGEVWGEVGGDGRSAMVRLLLPLAEPAAAPPARPQPRRGARGAAGVLRLRPLPQGRARPRVGRRRAAQAAAAPCSTPRPPASSPTEDELISIGAVRIVNGRLLRPETFDQLIDPGRPVRPESVAVHGISAELLEGQPRVRGGAAAVRAFRGGHGSGGTQRRLRPAILRARGGVAQA